MIFTSRDSSDPAAEALHGDVAEFRTPFVVFVPDIGERRMPVSVPANEVVPFFGIIGDNQKVVQLAELGKFVRYGIDLAVVFLFDFLHFGIQFGFLIDPEAAESFKETHPVARFKTFYIQGVNIQLFEKLYRFFFFIPRIAYRPLSEWHTS